ncbi:hypothetical protein PG994_012832 [Apiospora phragmitis]|uniref:Uncharacterized protein n=1 Tax=Apiospora phragmitis TaxID=2905665 RepID=A0ABR1T946_9PEZI
MKFVVPPEGGLPGNYTGNSNYVVGETMNISWVGGSVGKTYNLVMFQDMNPDSVHSAQQFWASRDERRRAWGFCVDDGERFWGSSRADSKRRFGPRHREHGQQNWDWLRRGYTCGNSGRNTDWGVVAAQSSSA